MSHHQAGTFPTAPGPQCAFPGCTRPPAPKDPAQPGRPAKYCDDPAHHRVAAFREKERRERQAAAEATAAAVGRLESARTVTAEAGASVIELVRRLEDEIRRLLDEAARSAVRIEELEQEVARLTLSGRGNRP
ncbi:hypothetical protein ACIGHB_29700 [Streptomyces sp. NPDC085460]|uniref:hypothetical protein n=1 Tax=Streptomyces sp. NPDC085460 TaxID=3365723 RepID=UPI0037D1CBBB